MRKLKLLFIILFGAVLFIPKEVFAYGPNLSTSVVNLTVGTTGTFNIISDHAVGRVDITSNNTGVATVTPAKEWVEDNVITVTITAHSAGTAIITVYNTDICTDDPVPVDMSDQYKTVTVNVSAPAPSPSPSPSPSPKPSPSPSVKPSPSPSVKPSPSPSTKPSTSATPKPSASASAKPSATPSPSSDVIRSSNNKLKSIKVEGFDLIKISDKEYELNVGSGTDKVNIIADSEDSKAIVTGIGEVHLKTGNNKIEVVITAEDGSKNVIIVKINRKDSYKLDEIEEALADKNNTSIEVELDFNSTVVSSDVINLIKNSGKEVIFNVYDESHKLAFGFVLDGSSIETVSSLDLGITYDSEFKDFINNLSNYANGVYVHYNSTNDFPKNSKVRLYVGDKFNDGDIVNVYLYDNTKDSLDLAKKETTVRDGFIETTADSNFDYFISMTNAGKSSSTTLFIVLGIVLGVIVIGGIILFIILKNKKKKDYGGMNKNMVAVNDSARAAAPKLVDINTNTQTPSPSEASPFDFGAAPQQPAAPSAFDVPQVASQAPVTNQAVAVNQQVVQQTAQAPVAPPQQVLPDANASVAQTLVPDISLQQQAQAPVNTQQVQGNNNGLFNLNSNNKFLF